MQNHVVRWLQTCWFPDVWQDSAEIPKGTVNSFCHRHCWVTCFLGILHKWLRREKNWRFVYHLSNSNSSIMGKENFISENTASFPNLLLLLCSEIGAVWFAWTYIYCGLPFISISLYTNQIRYESWTQPCTFH